MTEGEAKSLARLATGRYVDVTTRSCTNGIVIAEAISGSNNDFEVVASGYGLSEDRARATMRPTLLATMRTRLAAMEREIEEMRSILAKD
jgi:hypothetical protein